MTLAPLSSRGRRGIALRAPMPTFLVDPYREIADINSRFDQLIQTFFHNAPGLPSTGRWPTSLPVDVEETDDAYVVDIDLPNVDPGDIALEMSGEELHIAGQTRQREHTGVVRRHDRPEGEFDFLVDLPGDIDSDRVEATYANGVLTINVGKARDAHPRRIAIRVVEDAQPGEGRHARSERSAAGTPPEESAGG
jgi:HSP20 family protein